ncbi:MAG: hypothetical protein JXB26_20210 [Candidatus Aminicenantes bacterium]|nr:hypothetical protein [Candidatus Aminicenantes bacterium]
MKKVMGLLIIVLFGFPLLFGVVWAVGLTRAAVSPEFLSDMPQEIIAEIPDLVDEAFEEAQREDVITDDEARLWIKAAADTGISPKDLMRETGLLDWMENELSDSLYELGEMLRGKMRPRPIAINFRPLKEALLHEKIDEYMVKILENLPPCDESGNQRWLDAATDHEDLPPCRPDMDIAREVIRNERLKAVNDIEDEIEIFEGHRYFPFGVTRMVGLFSYFLFVFPLVFIVLGSVIASTGGAGFMRWTGLSLLIGGIFPFLSALITRNIISFGYGLWSFDHSGRWASELSDLFIDKVAWLGHMVISRLFTPVVVVGGIVCAVGLLLFILSFTMHRPQ